MKENGAKGDSPCSSSTTLTSTSSSSSNGSKPHNAYTFRDHMSTICNSFDTMNICEQTVALCSLLKRVNPFQSRFIVNILDHGQNNATTDDVLDMKLLEKDANDFAIAKEMESDSNENIINRLLYYLPLMKPGNEALKQLYLTLINRVASFSLTTATNIDETRQILCYSLIHPAINQDEKKALTFWCHQFESSIGQCGPHNATAAKHLVSATTQLLSSWRNTQHQHAFNKTSTYGAKYQLDGQQQQRNNKVRRSNSLTPICSTNAMTTATVGGSQPIWIDTSNGFRPSTQSFLQSSGAGTSMENNVMTTVNSCQLDWDHQPDKSSVCDYSSAKYDETKNIVSVAEQLQEKCSFSERGSGMKDVPVWLKSLRLHKYSSHFSKMSYETMMSLDEAELEKMNITKGARHKIVLNIQKLRQRQANLRLLEKSLTEEGISVLSEVLKELKYILSTPIKPYSLPSLSEEDHSNHKENISSSSSTSSCANNCECDTANQCVPEGDLPGQIVRMMAKTCSAILVPFQMDEEVVNTFISLINICLNQEYFSSVQKRKFSYWKIQLEKSRKTHQCRQVRGRKWTAVNGTRNCEARQTTSLPNNRQPNHTFIPSSNILSNQINLQNVGLDSGGAYCILKRQENAKCLKSTSSSFAQFHANLYRTQSAPVRQLISSSGHLETGLEYDRLNHQTESLCLRVTEQALESLDGGQTF